MMVNQTWTTGVYDLVETLTCRVRVLTLNHTQSGWGEQFASAQLIISTIEQLVQSELLVGDVWDLPKSPIGDQPLVEWSPGQVEPDLVQLERLVQGRWDERPAQTPVVAATHKAARLFGSSTGGLPPANHRNHDLLLAEVYVRYRSLQPELAANWWGEDAVAMAERGVKNPDAFLFDDSGNVVRVIESAGRYSLAQLESFHQHCETAALPYEFW